MRTYSRAYQLGQLRAYDSWADLTNDAATDLDDEDIVYVRDDFTVVRTPVVADARVLVMTVTPRWRDFCVDDLGFAVPADLDVQA